MFALARAEYEALVAARPFGPEELVDLAEVRWRTGDIAGAGDAAAAHLELGGGEGRALAIAAEAAAAIGRTAEAERLAVRALERLDVPPADLFAGIPMRAGWPAGHIDSSGGGPRSVVASRPSATEDPEIESARFDPREELDAARDELADGEDVSAVVRLAIVLRFEPSLAPAILEIVAQHADPMFALLRGDAYRIVGRELDAQRAYDVARASLDDGAGSSSEPGGRAVR